MSCLDTLKESFVHHGFRHLSPIREKIAKQRHIVNISSYILVPGEN